MSFRVFVYGSLKRGLRHHRQLGAARFVREASLEGHALFRVGEYPAAVPAVGGTVLGEVYEVSERTLRRLDVFEDCPELYQRVAVQLTDGEVAWVYTMTPLAVAGSERLPTDRWDG